MNLAICDNMDGPRGHYAKWNESDRKTNTLGFHLYVDSKNVKLKETESRLVFASSYGSDGNGEMFVKGCKVAVTYDE